MSANFIIFDPTYIEGLIRNINKANTLIDEAKSILKQASSHEKWRCPEVKDINEIIRNMSSKLNNFDRGLSATSNALSKGKQNFQSLETRGDRQATQLAQNLREKYGFIASVRGTGQKVNLPTTGIPKTEDNLVVKVIKGTAKKAIQGLGSVFGLAIGALSNCLYKTTEGFLEDVKEAFITPMVNIFQASYDIVRPPYNVAQNLIKIATNSASLIANAVTLGGAAKLAGAAPDRLLSITLGDKVDDIANLSISKADKILIEEAEKAINTGGKIGDFVTIADSAKFSINGAQNVVSQDPEALKSTVDNIVGLVTEVAAPFGLDKTILKGVEGAFNGAKDGATVGYNIATMLCNVLGL